MKSVDAVRIRKKIRLFKPRFQGIEIALHSWRPPTASEPALLQHKAIKGSKYKGTGTQGRGEKVPLVRHYYLSRASRRSLFNSCPKAGPELQPESRS